MDDEVTKSIMKMVDEYATRRIGEGTAKARAAVVAAIDALTKDVERMRWLKRSDWVRWDGPDDGVGWTLDQAIDAAIAAQKGAD